MSFSYYRRILQAYFGRGSSQLSFWHETPAINAAAFDEASSAYYMSFAEKALYRGPFDERGVPMLDYRGSIGKQYNPIAVAQYALACGNYKCKAEGGGMKPERGMGAVPDSKAEGSDFAKATSDKGELSAEGGSASGGKPEKVEGRGAEKKDEGQTERNESLPANSANQRQCSDSFEMKFLTCAEWLRENLEPNQAGQWVWQHKFDWEYFRTLKAPWYSGLAQGQGISVMLRAYRETGDLRFMEAAERAFTSMLKPLQDGGTLFTDHDGDLWIEEYITDPPTHILNGFMWALWGVYDIIRIGRAEGGNLRPERVREETPSRKDEGGNLRPEMGAVPDRKDEGSDVEVKAEGGPAAEQVRYRVGHEPEQARFMAGQEPEQARFMAGQEPEQARHRVGENLERMSALSLAAKDLWDRCIITLEKNLPRFDCGYWSMYDLAPLGMRNVASPFYHKLHIVQLDVMHRLTGRSVFAEYRDKWSGYQGKSLNRRRAFAAKCIFKLRYY